MQVQCLSSCPGPHVGSILKHCSVLNALCYYPFPLCSYLSIMSSMLWQRGPGSVPHHWQCRSLCVFACSWMKTELFSFFFCHRLLVLKCNGIACTQETGVFGTTFVAMSSSVTYLSMKYGDGIFRCPTVRLWKHSIDFSSLHYLDIQLSSLVKKILLWTNKYWKRWRKEFYSLV